MSNIFAGFTIKDTIDGYVSYLSAKNNIGLLNKQTTIDELTATTGLLAQQNEAQRLARENASVANTFDIKKYAGWALLAGGAFFAYKLLK